MTKEKNEAVYNCIVGFLLKNCCIVGTRKLGSHQSCACQVSTGSRFLFYLYGHHKVKAFSDLLVPLNCATVASNWKLPSKLLLSAAYLHF